MTKWKYDEKFPTSVSPLVTIKIVFIGYLPFAEKYKSGVIMALDKETGQKLWESDLNPPLGQLVLHFGMECYLCLQKNWLVIICQMLM